MTTDAGILRPHAPDLVASTGFYEAKDDTSLIHESSIMPPDYATLHLTTPKTHKLSVQTGNLAAPNGRNIQSIDKYGAGCFPPSPLSDLDLSPRIIRAATKGASPTSYFINPVSQTNGRAATGGKSGRVIEKLMNENDRLSREKKLALVQYEEELSRGESARATIESLRVSMANLQSLHESDEALLAKRDRKLKEAKEDLNTERLRRESAEATVEETRKERDASIQQMQHELLLEKEQRQLAVSRYEMLSNSWTSLEERYRKQVDDLKTSLDRLREDLLHDRQAMSEMEEKSREMATEVSKVTESGSQAKIDLQNYRHEMEMVVQAIKAQGKQHDSMNTSLQNDLVEVLGRMKWVMNVQRDSRAPE